MSISNHIAKQLDNRRNTNSLRSLSQLTGLIDFCSNDYLGLAKTETSIPFGEGSTGSRLISGNTAIKEETEQFLANFYGAEAALVFNSGYDANVGLFSSLGHRNSVFLYDELCHASIRDGIRLSLGKSFSFRHNNLSDLERLLKKHALNDVVIAIESVYSMDGDQADSESILHLASQYNTHIIVDEAHAVGVFGQKGVGLFGAEHPNLLAKVVTFGKAFGFHGAAIIGSGQLRTYLINFARSFIYSTALPDQDFETIRQRHQTIAASDHIRQELRQLEQIFKDNLPDWLTLNQQYQGPIFPVIVGDIERCRKMEQSLRKAGFAAKAILSPTVPKGTERLRITLHAFNTPESVLSLLEQLDKAWNESL